MNRLFTLTVFMSGYWAVTEFMIRQAPNAAVADFWNRAIFLWPFFAALLMNFTLEFTENSFLRKRRNYLVIYVPATVFSLIELFTNQIGGDIELVYWGYTYTTPQTWLGVFCNAWSGILAYLALLLCLKYYVQVKDELKKQQTKFMTIGFAIPILVFSITQALLPAFGLRVPEMGNTFSAFMSVFVAYAIWKHQLFQLGPEIAAETILRTMPDSLILADTEQTILRTNASLTDLLGYTEKELKGKHIRMLFPDEYTHNNVINEFKRTHEIRNMEITLKTKSGENRCVGFSASLVSSRRGRKVGITCIAHDLTSRKQMEQKLLKAERFASIGELAGMVGHDLRNPLTSIRGATYYLKRKYGPKMDTDGVEMLNTIETSIQYSNKIVRDLVDYSGELTLELATTTPKQLLTDALTIVATPPNVQVTDLTTDIHFEADSSQICRVFVNIIKNSFDALPSGGTLTVISDKKPDGTVVIVFTDDGQGMSKEALDRIWTLLFTTKAKGMGFGLPICKRIVEAHGGKIYAQSVVGQGTTITISFPTKQNKT